MSRQVTARAARHGRNVAASTLDSTRAACHNSTMRDGRRTSSVEHHYIIQVKRNGSVRLTGPDGMPLLDSHGRVRRKRQYVALVFDSRWPREPWFAQTCGSRNKAERVARDWLENRLREDRDYGGI